MEGVGEAVGEAASTLPLVRDLLRDDVREGVPDLVPLVGVREGVRVRVAPAARERDLVGVGVRERLCVLEAEGLAPLVGVLLRLRGDGVRVREGVFEGAGLGLGALATRTEILRAKA